MLAISLPNEIETRLDALAQATGRTKAFYAQEAIREYLDDLEDLYLAEKRLSEIRAGQRETIPIEEVIQAEERHPRSWHLLLNDPVADDDFLKERLPIIDESRFIKGFE